jgi:uncharacterized membrane protein (UPF0127 family)
MARPLALAALAALHCASPSPEPAGAARVIVETSAGARLPVAVEVARTDAERAKGLMHRRSLAKDAGMLFVFDETAEHPFWMKNTLIPLDIVFIAEDGRVAAIVHAVPGDLAPRSGGVPSRYVLEVNGGWTDAHGVRPGDRVRFENLF